MRKALFGISLAIIMLMASVGCAQAPEHVHTFSAEWTHDATHHWHEPTCGHDVVSGKAEHSWDEGTVTKEATHTTDGVMTYTCTVCKATRTEDIPAKKDEHTFSADWTCDGTYHWHAATCGHDVVSGKAEHLIDSEGVCQVCGMGLFEVDSEGVLTVVDKSLISGAVSIPSTIGGIEVTTIPEGAFEDCTSMTEITIPASVTSIGKWAFYGCTCSVVFAEGMTTIPSSALFQAFGITSVTIPPSVTSIGDHAFYNCTALTSVSIPSMVTSIGDHAFDGCKSLTEITMGSLVVSIGKWAFSGCEGLTSVTIPTSVKTIGDDAFYYCIGLTEITIPSSVESIGNDAFNSCAGLTEITIPSTVSSLGCGAFGNCTGLTEINFPSSISSIVAYLFSGCTALTKITIPSSVTSIGEYAFSDCTGLTTIDFQGTESQWNAVGKGDDWKESVPATVVHCTDGDVPL